MSRSALPPHLAEFVRVQVASGRYSSEEEIVREGLELLRERDRRLEDLRGEILPALDSLDRGEGRPMDLQELKRRFRQEHRSE